MAHVVRKFAALALLLALSLQGVAAATSDLQCSRIGIDEIHFSGSGGGAEPAQTRDWTEPPLYHAVCHQPPLAMPVLTKVAAGPGSHGIDTLICHLASLYFPEQPHRPPFAQLT